MIRTTWVEMSRSALVSNLKKFQRLVQPSLVMPIIKSNAYGHGLVEVAQTIQRQRIWGVGVANTAEGLILRRSGFRKPILVLNWAANSDRDAAIKAGLQFTVYDKRFLAQLERQAARLKKKVIVHLKYDSGTTRLGLTDADFLALVRYCLRLKHVTLGGIFSHLAESESATQTYTRRQLQRFEHIRQQAVQLGFNGHAHIACTAATVGYTASRYDINRVGIGLYGLWPSDVTKKKAPASLAVQPVLSWYTRIIQIKPVPRGTPIGYGRSYVTKQPSKIAVLPVGYWDGLDRGLSNRGVVLVNGVRCPIRGRVCMNLTMVDVTGIRNVTVGTKVTLIGQSGRGVVTADDMARNSDTINYETVTRINPLIPRIRVA